jgi:hypothetical protein
MGTASGKPEGGALVVQTRGLTSVSLLDASGMPHSDALVITERFQLTDRGRTLVNELTFEDAQTFSRPWTTRVTYRRMPEGTMYKEDVCRERAIGGKSAFPRLESLE